MSTHVPPQGAKPVEQVMSEPEPPSVPIVASMPEPASGTVVGIVQRPLWQLYPMGHALPQPPQLSGCEAMSTQRSRQKRSPAPQVGTSGAPASVGPGIRQCPSPQS
jgi:hypothetical protein